MGPVHWRDELAEKSLEDILHINSCFKPEERPPPSPSKNKGSLILGNPRKYSFLARSFTQELHASNKNEPARRRSQASKISPARDAESKYVEPKGGYYISKLNKKGAERTWLQSKIKQYFTDPAKKRKGELPTALVKALWGPTPKTEEDEASDAATDDLIRKLTKLKKPDEEKAPECLMDVLLQSWTYFNHSHSKVNTVGNHVHAKYCEKAFDHFLLPDGTQVHGSYIISLQRLITELRGLLNRLKAKVIHTDYKVVRMWRPPQLEEVAEFALPPFKEFPPLYPIKGLLKAPKEDLPASSSVPALITPTPMPHPPFVPRAVVKAPVLHLPTLRDFSVERKSIDYTMNQDLLLPTFEAPEPLPLPVWQEPEELLMPPEPQLKETEILPIPILEAVPPYMVQVAQPRPCEASYYPVSDLKPSICDGVCGNSKNPATGKAGKCLAMPPNPPTPMPSPPGIEIHLEPLFEPPVEEPIPPFKPPPLKPEPKYVSPPKPDLPAFSPPPPPTPIGYLAGQRPVFLVECSNSMAGERMKVAQEALRYLFSKGGQVDIAASHFDIIMYSFDAWSYGALEEDRQYKLTGGPVRYWLKNLEVMQPKTPATVDKALTWISKWQTGGRSNLLKALEVAFERKSADCIYLLTGGKPERPVIVMNALKKWAKERGTLIPVHPVGLAPSKLGARFMMNLAQATGGQFQELDLRWQSKVNRMEGVASEDRSWAEHMIAQEQRRSLEAGTMESMDSIIERLKDRFQHEKQGPRLTKFLEEENKAKEIHIRLCETIREENTKAIADSKRTHEQATASIKERNKQNYDNAWKSWDEEVQSVRAFNSQWKALQTEWGKSVMEFEEARRKSIEDARRKFSEDVRRIEERNAFMKEHSKEIHEAEVKEIKEKNERLKKDTEARQAELFIQTEAHNRELRRQYEESCLEIKSLNSRVLEKARADFSAACEAIRTENQLKLEEAKQDFARTCEEVAAENLRRKNEYKSKLDELHVRMESAIAVHQQQVAAIVTEHDANLAKIAAINATLEEQAKRDWEEECKRIDEENQRTLDSAVKKWEIACRAVQEENERLDKKRLAQYERSVEVELLNEEITKKKKAEWKELCKKLEREYEEEVENARMDHENYINDVNRRNEEALEAAKVAHSAQLAAVEQYNETIRPYVEASKLVQKEINRVNLFLKHVVDKLEMPTFEKSKTSRKHTLEQRLDLLSGKEHPCHPKVICEALHVAYADDVKAGTFPEKPPASTRFAKDATLPTKPRSKFSGMVPISPTRVTAHHCNVSDTSERERSTKDFLAQAVKRQQVVAAIIAPMVKARG